MVCPELENNSSFKLVPKSMQNGLMLMKLEKKPMIGIFLTRVEKASKRMADFAENYKKGFNVVVDFVCPTPQARKLFNQTISRLILLKRKI